jgi:GNAT superfamily N-acetyltransferase
MSVSGPSSDTGFGRAARASGEHSAVPLGPQHLDAVCALHRRLHELAPRPGLFAVESREFFARHLEQDGRILGVFDAQGELTAYAVLGLPRADDPENFGRDIGLPEGELGTVAHLDGIGVHPEWRGHGLHRALISERIALATAAGRRVVLSMAAPGNRWSLGNLLASGGEVVALIPKYGAMRFVVRYRQSPGPTPSGPAVPLDDLERHAALLAEGWRGVALETADSGEADSGEAKLLYAAGDGTGP